jgi:hypothetical protein
MKPTRAMFIAGLLACAAALAQTTNPYNGNWTATWEHGKGMRQHVNQADVVIADNGGSFDNRYSSTRNPCAGRKAPITVKTATASELVFVIGGSTVLQGCRDIEVRVRRVDERTLKGLRDKDQEITLTRK